MARPVRDAVPIGPFADWCTHLIERTRREIVRADVVETVHGDTPSGATVTAALVCGVDESQLRRWARGDNSNTTGTIALARVDEVLTAAGEGHRLSELYPPSDRGRRYHAGGKPRGKYRKMTDAQVRAAHRLYEAEGLSTHDLATILWQRFGYASHSSCVTALLKGFHGLALPVRDRHEAVRLHHVRHGRRRADGDKNALRRERRAARFRPCAGTHTGANGGAGTPCPRPAASDSDFCRQHDPALQAQRTRELAAMRERRLNALEMVPLEPFARYVDHLVEREGSGVAAAAVLGCSKHVVSNVRRRVRTDSRSGGRAPWVVVSRQWVERYLSRVEGAPSFDELYATQTAAVAA